MTLKRTAFLLILVFLVAGSLYFARGRPDIAPERVPERLDLLGFGMTDLKNFEITEHFGQYFSDNDERNISAQKGEDILRIKIIPDQDKEQAKRYKAGQLLLLEAQYDSRLPPYPEFLTNQTGCAEDFLPRRRETEEGIYLLVNSDERFNYGLCSEDLVRYKAGFGIFYCEQERKLFQVEYFTDKSKAWNSVEEFMSSFSCVPA